MDLMREAKRRIPCFRPDLPLSENCEALSHKCKRDHIGDLHMMIYAPSCATPASLLMMLIRHEVYVNRL